jgi:hypothetical protein
LKDVHGALVSGSKREARAARGRQGAGRDRGVQRPLGHRFERLRNMVAHASRVRLRRSSAARRTTETLTAHVVEREAEKASGRGGIAAAMAKARRATA